MDNILLWSRATDRKILIAGVVACFLLLAAAIGSALPTPEPVDGLSLLQGLIAASMLAFVWGGFRVARPARRGGRWVVAEAIVVPLVWGLLVAVLGFWL